MKVVVVGPVYPYRGGIAHYTTLLARALAARHEVAVISFRRQFPRLFYPGASDKDPSEQSLRVDAEYLLDPIEPWGWWQTARRIGEIAPDVVVIQWWTTFWAPAFVALGALLRRKRLKLLYLIHNVLPHEARPWDRWLARLALGRAQAFIVQTAREEQRLRALLPDARVVVAPHPVYDMFAAQALPKAAARRRLGLPDERPVVLFFGLVRPYKGLRYLLEAAGLLARQGTPVSLVVAGECWGDKEQYRQQIARLGLAESVRLEDRYIPNEEVGLFFSAADVLAAPYTGGTQSGAIQMARGFGLPVVATEALFPRDARGNGAGQVRVVPPGDAAALAAAIRVEVERRDDAGAGDHPSRPTPTEDGWDQLVRAIEAL